MPMSLLKTQPGINTEYTAVLNSTGWTNSNRIRWRMGLPEKIGGWVHLNETPLVGLGRGIHAWTDLNDVPYLAIGTEQRLMLFSNGILSDITPLRRTSNPVPNFSAAIGSPLVTVVDPGSNVGVGDWINLPMEISLGQILLKGLYQVTSVISINSYVINIGMPSPIKVVSGGTVPSFSSTAAFPVITVFFAGHGLSVGSSFPIGVATTIAGISLNGFYTVRTVIDANTFTIIPGPLANATATVFENGGNAQIQYLIATGLASAAVGSGYGAGLYGAGIYGDAQQSGPQGLLQPIRLWFLDNWGQDLIGNYTGSTVYVWTPPYVPGNTAGSRAQAITGAPTAVNGCFVAMPQQILVCWGCTTPGLTADDENVQDPNLICWSDVDDYTDFIASTSNQAGQFRIPTGSRVVGGLQAPQFGCFWTDVDFWVMQYLGYPLVFGFNKIAGGTGLIAPKAAGVYQQIVYWCSAVSHTSQGPNDQKGNFFTFDGNTVQPIPCPVWDTFFLDLDNSQVDKVFCAINSLFGEIYWFYPSVSGGTGEVDSYVKLTVTEGNVWDIGKIARTCWTDSSVFGNPIGTDTAGLIQQHETAYDDDGNLMGESITSGYADISSGDQFMSVKRFLPDFKWQGAAPGTVEVSLQMIDYADGIAPIAMLGPYSVIQAATPYFTTKGARGRGVAITLGNSGLGCGWRLGAFRFVAQPSGRR